MWRLSPPTSDRKTIPMDEIKQRLKDASDACIATYEAWRGKSSEAGAREALQEAVHELRKVAARLEIELAVSDRKSQGNEPIPIPSHRASRRQGGPDIDGDDDNRANRQQGGRDGNRGERDGNRGPRDAGGNNAGGGAGGGSRPVQIRRPQENAAPVEASSQPAAQPGNETPAAGGEEEGVQRKPRPLSLKRGAPDAE